MPRQIAIAIAESEQTLASMLRNTTSPRMKSRLKALLLIKTKKCLYVKHVAKCVKYDKDTIHCWIRIYQNGGLAELLTMNSGGNGIKKISEPTHNALAEKLNDPSTTVTSYVELLNWVREHYQSDLKYGALRKYCRHHFKSKLKVARKSHIKKDPMAEEVFKKTT